MEPLVVREFERIQGGEVFSAVNRVVTPRQHAALERFDDDYRKRLGVTVFAHGPKRSLVAQNFVGVINVGRHQIEILPKIEGATTQVRRSLARMIATALELELHGDDGTRTDSHADSVLEVLIKLFTVQLWQAVRRGMVRRYERHADELTVLRGKLDLPRQVRRSLVQPQQLCCRFDEFTENNPLNRMLKAALRVLHRVSRSQANQRRVAELLFCFQDVEDIGPAAVAWEEVMTDRLSTRYEPVVRLARLFLDGTSPDVVTGGDQGFALLFDMNELFEAYVGATARRVLGRKGFRVHLQGPTRHLAEHANGAGAFAMRPDIVVSRGAEVIVVVDTKWKRLRLTSTREGVSSADAYQMHAYARQYGAPEVMLLYPHHAELGSWKVRRAEYLLRDLGRVPPQGACKVSVATADLSDLQTVGVQIEKMFENLLQAGAA